MNNKQIRQRLISALKQPVLLPLYLYTHYVSLLFAPRCRFYPSCSRYAYEAVNTHGVWVGLRLAILRLLRCHPWHEGGIDLVPQPEPSCCSDHSPSLKEYLP